jgi:hypothetical protein
MTGLLGAFARGYLICRSLRTQPDPWLDRLFNSVLRGLPQFGKSGRPARGEMTHAAPTASVRGMTYLRGLRLVRISERLQRDAG